MSPTSGLVVLLISLLVPLATWAAAPPVEGAGGVAGLADWVPAEEAFSDGALREELFSGAERAEIASWLRPSAAPGEEVPGQVPASGVSKNGAAEVCDVLFVESHPVDTSDPKEALREASVAFLGTVTSVEPGLFRGRLASIVAVQVDRWLVQSSDLEASETVYLLQNDARIRVGGTTYCRRSARAEQMETGRRVFVATSNVLEEEPAFLLPYDSQLFIETAGGVVSATGKETPETAGSWASFAERVVQLAQEGQ